MVLRNPAVKYNTAAFSKLSFAVRWQGRAKQRLVLQVTTLKLLTTAAMVDNLAEKVDECPLKRGH